MCQLHGLGSCREELFVCSCREELFVCSCREELFVCSCREELFVCYCREELFVCSCREELFGLRLNTDLLLYALINKSKYSPGNTKQNFFFRNKPTNVPRN